MSRSSMSVRSERVIRLRLRGYLQFGLMPMVVAVSFSIVTSILSAGRDGWQWTALGCACAFIVAAALSLTVDLVRRRRAAQRSSSQSES